jgi:hypothetical protein
MPKYHEPKGRVKIHGEVARVTFDGIDHTPRFCLERREVAEILARKALAEAAAHAEPGFEYNPEMVGRAVRACAGAQSGNAIEVPIEVEKPAPAPAAAAPAPAK